MSKKIVDLVNYRFDRLIVIQINKICKDGNYDWLCQCDCGQQTIVRGNNLKNGHTRSCGCLKKETITKHGHCINQIKSITNTTWGNMIQRCNNPNHISYKNYGGRGIKVCKRWLKFENFLEDMGEKSNGLTIDRINNNGDYCKENCRWATTKQQSCNHRRNILFTIDGITKCLMDWCNELNLNYSTVYSRIYIYKWTFKEAIELTERK